MTPLLALALLALAEPSRVALLPPRVAGVAAPFDVVVEEALKKSGVETLGWRALSVSLPASCDPLAEPACLSAALAGTPAVAVAQLLADRSGDKLGVRLRVFGVDGVIKDEQRLEAPIDGAGAASDALLVAAFGATPPEPPPPPTPPPSPAAEAPAAVPDDGDLRAAGTIVSIAVGVGSLLAITAGTFGLISSAISEPEWALRARGHTFPQNADDPVCGGSAGRCVVTDDDGFEQQVGWTRGYGPAGSNDQVGQGARFAMVAISRDNELQWEETQRQGLVLALVGSAATVASGVALAYFTLPDAASDPPP